MAGEDAAAAARRPPKEEEEDDDDEFDNVPLALSRAKKPGNASASKVKKEVEDDDDDLDNVPLALSRAKKGNEKQKGNNSNMKASSKVKKEVSSDDDFVMPTAQKKSAGAAGSNAKTSKVKKIKDEDLEDLKEDKKRKKRVGVKEEAKLALAIVKGEKVKKERKVYGLPGQKHDPPEERDPLRIFYESLYEQVPTSDMAATWLMEWGLLPLDVARKCFEKKQGQKVKSPVKAITAKRIPSSPAKTLPSSAKKLVMPSNSAGKLKSQKKRKASDDTDDDDDDDDFVASKAKTKRHKA